MATMVTSGKAALAVALKSRDIHFAWGRGETWWNADIDITAAFAGTPQAIVLPHAPVAEVVVSPAAGGEPFVENDDFVWDAASGRITRVITGAIPSGATVKIAGKYGRPDPASSLTALIDEVGRRVASTVITVVPDPDGPLSTSDGNYWTASATPTRFLYLSVLFDFAEAADQVIREVGVFVDTVRKAGIPTAQPHLLPAEIQSPGLQLIAHRRKPLIRDPVTRQGFSFVIAL
ncbi:hypothetical protein [Rhodopseudomonas sp. BR0G17]|uniref:hypothetical protein n=1 Tax=Rhodopseudomonas sp. BR0G17 TaxID=2269368 RepID=UPI0013E051D2|nr:hypothetical protein [Rhodopseudomonas sp. BR0G17]NEW96911.1 hypothetical protein [Rhodopseudomonas sp. BR0G17]